MFGTSGAPRSDMRAQLLGAFSIVAGLVCACGGASTGATTTTTSGIARVSDGERIRRLEALQSRNPEWTVRPGDDGRVVITSRWASSLRREDIRPEVEQFFAANAHELGLDDAAMARVTNDADHVRYERRGKGRGAVDARLEGGAIVVTAE